MRRSISTNSPNQQQDRLEEPFFKHAREVNKLNCVQMSHGLFISFLMLSLQYSGQYLSSEQTLSLPSIFSKSSFDGNQIGDYIEPLYMFWIGFHVQISIKKQYRKTLTLWGNLSVRFIAMLLIGFFINSILCKFNYTQFRIMGFFQRILLMNILIILLHLYTDKKIQYFFVVLFFMASLGLLATVKGQECPRIQIDDPQCNGICYLDYKILTPNHMQFATYDQDGLFATFNVLFITYVGYSFGKLLKNLGNKNIKRVLIYWTVGSIILGLTGYLTKITWPFIPPIYSTNFTMFSAGIGGLILLLLYVMFDLFNQKYPLISKIFFFLRWFGKNGLFLFGMRCLIEAILISQNATHVIVNKIGFFPSNQMNGLFYNFLFYIAFLLISFGLHKTNITIRF